MSLNEGIARQLKTEHEGAVVFRADPMASIVASGLATPVGNGLFVLQGALAGLLEQIENLVMELARSAGAQPAHVPSMLAWENVQKSAYLQSFADQALVVDPYEGRAHAEHEGLSSPTVCYHYFSSLAGKTVENNFSVTALSKCSRKEAGPLANLGRLTNFTMREVVFFGSEAYCRQKRQELLEKTAALMSSAFDLSFKVVTASDPFFGENNEIKKQAQLLSESKYELQAALPFSDSSVSVASFNYHGKIFYDRFGIGAGKPELNYSGCVGWGYERILYAMLAQKGVDFTSAYYRTILRS